MNTKIETMYNLIQQWATADKEAKQNLLKEAQQVFKTLTKEEIKELEDKIKGSQINWLSVKGHQYSWRNLVFLSRVYQNGWVFGTYKQWKEQNLSVIKWEHWFPILVPIIDKDTDKIKYLKTVFIFEKAQTEAIKGDE